MPLSSPLRLPLRLGLTALAARRGGGVTPSLTAQVQGLFAAYGVTGGMYDFLDFSTQSQDASGAVPVTAGGQQVGRILDLSGNAFHATQSSSSMRPLSSSDGAIFDGVDDLLVAGISSSNTNAQYLAASFSYTFTTDFNSWSVFALRSANDHYLLRLAIRSQNPAVSGFNQPSAQSRDSGQTPNISSVSRASNTIPGGVTHSLVAIYDPAAKAIKLSLNNDSFTEAIFTGDATQSPTSLSFGRESLVGTPIPTTRRRVFWMQAEPSALDRQLINDWLMDGV